MEIEPERKPFTVSFNDRFPEPTTLPEAISRRESLLLETQSIQNQLSDYQKPGGLKPVAEENFQAWRRNARTALMIKQAQHRMLKAWCKQHETEHDRRPLERLFRLVEDWITMYDIEPTDLEDEFLAEIRKELGLPDEVEANA